MANSQDSTPDPNSDVDAVNRVIDAHQERIDRGTGSWFDHCAVLFGRLSLIHHEHGEQGIKDALDPSRFAFVPQNLSEADLEDRPDDD